MAAGFTFTTRTPHNITIQVFGKDEVYDILNVIEFTSARKRMSVIVRTPTGQIKVLIKGADNVIYERMAPNQEYKGITLKHLEQFASIGIKIF